MTLADAYHFCWKQARHRNENFPLALIGTPTPIKQSIYALYVFARLADDIVDEGDLTALERTTALRALSKKLDLIATGQVPQEPLFIALADTQRHYQIQLNYLQDLLQAFQQDITQHSYHDFQEVLHYCRCSANPIGRLLLQLHQQETAEHILASDALCTALQLLNFMQDVESDLLLRNRCYLPQVDLQEFDITLTDIRQQRKAAAYQQVLDKQLERIANLLRVASPILNLKGSLGLQAAVTLTNAESLLQRCRQRQDCFTRPILTGRMKISCFFLACCRKIWYDSTRVLSSHCH